MQSSQSGLQDLFACAKDSKAAASIIAGLDKVARDSLRLSSDGALIISYSGGIDSSILAKLAGGTGNESDSVLLSLGAPGSRDINDLRMKGETTKTAIRHVIKEVEREKIEKTALKVSGMVQVSSISHLEDCVAFYLVAEEAQKLSKINVIASANGPDELYCGYDRFRRILDEKGYEAVNEEIKRALQIANDLRRQVRKVVAAFGLRSVEPFLSGEFVDFSLKVPVELKILKENDRLRKRLWREYGRSLSLPDHVVMKEKKAMQYSMGIHNVVLPMVRKNEINLTDEKLPFS